MLGSCVLRLTVVSRLRELIDYLHQRHPSFQNRATPLAAEGGTHEVGGIVLKTRVPLVLYEVRRDRRAERRFCR